MMLETLKENRYGSLWVSLQRKESGPAKHYKPFYIVSAEVPSDKHIGGTTVISKTTEVLDKAETWYDSINQKLRGAL